MIGDPIDREFRRLVASYPGRTPRQSLDTVRELQAAADLHRPPTVVVVVGTNGKTSTSTYLARIATGAGLRTGLTTSPHVRRWGERIVINGQPVDDEEFLQRLTRLHGLATDLPNRSELRFFDLVTLAAEEAFSEADVDVAVFEAGIGGRLDATKLLEADLVLLTSIGIDHVELLGDTPEQILSEKIGVAPRGGTILSAALGGDLDARARTLAADAAVDISFVRAEGTVLERNAALAVAAAKALEIPSPPTAELASEPVVGRLQHLAVGGVDVLLDAAHNPQAWARLADAVPAGAVAVVSASADRPVADLRTALSRTSHVVVTEAWPDRSYPPAALAEALGHGSMSIEPNPIAAVRQGLDRAREQQTTLVVFGSAYLLPHAFSAFD